MPARKKREFSKVVVAVSWAASLLWITFSFFLSWHGRDPNSTVTVTIVTETLATTLGYFGYQGFLKHSRNKTKVDADGLPFGSTTPEPPGEAAP
jgi:hypothetical protein